ncbi:HAD-IIB family hydrolase [Sagittula sp. M10.9X]|uniref:sucrose-phosphate synthase n=1 Tax=Sagittula salina TaxID=2820268 RepID=A0A940MQQ2_9RHOB|nr:HAD-IIB family hydrolase [Sagittula salina]
MTEDTGGHIAYVLGAALAQSRQTDTEVTIVTRAFDAPRLGAGFGLSKERVTDNCTIRRLRTACSDYLSKDALEAELPALTEAFVAMLADGPRPDVIHAHFGDAAALAIAAEDRFGIPWIYSSHSLGHEKCSGRAPGAALRRRIVRERRAVERASAIVASSRDEAERQIAGLSADAEGRVHRVSPGVTVAGEGVAERARSRVAPFLRAPEKPVILAIARPIAKKNLDGLLRAYAQDEALQEKANLVIVAGLREGLHDADAEKQAVIRGLFDIVDRHDLWGKVALPRHHRPEDIPDFYALASEGGVFCNPAHHEPFGLTIIEAACSGVPVVATRCGGPVDILATLGLGGLCDPQDPASIASALHAVLDMPERAVRVARARRQAQTAYDWNAWAEDVRRISAGISLPTTEAGPVAATDLLACDIDGTLTGDRQAARRFEAWRADVPEGVRFAVATGRSLPEARRVLCDWGIAAPATLITSVGTEIWRRAPGGGYRLCRDFAQIIHRYWQRDRVAEVLEANGVSWQPGYEQRRWKLSLVGTAGDADRIATVLRDRGLPTRVIASHGRFIDVVPCRAGKAQAILFEAERLGLLPTEVIVAGDSGNDRDMLETFARAILPGNALAELDSLCTGYRARQSHAAGVLEGLEYFGLAGGPCHDMAAE